MIRVDDRDDLNWIQGPGRGSDSAELTPPALSLLVRVSLGSITDISALPAE